MSANSIQISEISVNDQEEATVRPLAYCFVLSVDLYARERESERKSSQARHVERRRALSSSSSVHGAVPTTSLIVSVCVRQISIAIEDTRTHTHTHSVVRCTSSHCGDSFDLGDTAFRGLHRRRAERTSCNGKVMTHLKTAQHTTKLSLRATAMSNP